MVNEIRLVRRDRNRMNRCGERVKQDSTNPGEARTALSGVQMNSPQVGVGWNKRDFCVTLFENDVGERPPLEWTMGKQRTQREPEKSISKTTFWWLVYTRRGVSSEGTRGKTETRI